jgi:hypothetical protein
VYGRVSLDRGKTFVTAAELKAQLAPVFANRGTAFTADQKALVRSVVDRFRALHGVVLRLVSASKERVAARSGSDLDIEQKLGEWLSPALIECKNGPLASTCAAAGAAATGWNGYRDLASPLSEVADELDHLLEDQDDALAAGTGTPASIATAVEITGPAADAMAISGAEITQKDWVTAYFTPVVGAAFVFPKGSTQVIQPYAGVQFHFSASPIDDPLWSHGVSDFRRFFAIEFGLLTTNSTFGTDNRFRGPGGFAPVVFGGAIHPIPYVSLAAGGAVFDERSTTLVAQQPHTVVAANLGLNVQANLPDLVRFAVTGGSASIIAANGGGN